MAPAMLNPPIGPVPEKVVGSLREIRVLYVGAGFAGFTLAHSLTETKMERSVHSYMYKKNHDVGGTRLQNKYPGLAW